MPYSSGPNTVNDSIVFNYDIGDVANSYKGEPTTNAMRQSDDVTGVSYGSENEYSTCQLVKTWYPNIKTPIGYGATKLTQQAVTSIWQCLNWFDANEDGKRCLSAYIYPLTSGITNFTIGMVGDANNSVVFNLDTGGISVGGGLSAANPFITPVIGAPGWYRIGANIEGRNGGWVASIGLGQLGEYTPSSPFKSFYICGIQYERGIAQHCTQFTPAQTSRSTTQGLLDISGKSNTIDLANMSYDNNAQFYFDATDDYISVPNSDNFKTNQVTVELIIKFNSFKAADLVQFGVGSGAYAQWYFRDLGNGNFNWFIWGLGSSVYSDLTVSRSSLSTGNYYHIVCTTSNSITTSVYYNGNLAGTAGSTAYNTAASWTPAAMTIGGFSWDGYSNTNIPVCKIYNRVLSTTEIQQNYLAYKTRFNLS